VATRILNSLKSLVASRIFQICVGASISLLALYLVTQEADFHAVLGVLGKASPIALFAALLSVIVNTVAKAARWRLLLGPGGREIPGMRILSSLLGGQLLNALLPVRLGELSRAYDIGGLGPGRTFVLGGIVIEKIIDMACLAALVLLLIAWLPVPAWMTRSAYFSLAAGAVVVVVIFVLVRRLDWLTLQLQGLVSRLPGRIRRVLEPRLQAGLGSLRVLTQSGVQSRTSVWSLVIWGSAILTNQLVLVAFNIQLPITAACLVLLALMVGASVPNIAAGLGIFEYLCVMSLGVFGVDANTALSYGLMLHVLVLVPMILVGPIYLFNLWRSRRAGLV
jgi:glycosyltransferase 2 family protein